MLNEIRQEPHRFILMDGLRGLAALCVGMLHAGQLYNAPYSLPHAYLAVDFFFCLSGFVIAYSYDRRFAEGLSNTTFMLRRLIRLYPMILVAVLLGGGIMVAHALVTEVQTIPEVILVTAGTLLLFPAGLIFGLQAYPPDNPVWSIVFELAANLVYALTSKFEALYHKSLASLALGFMLTGLLLLAIRHAGSVDPMGFEGIENFLLGFLRVGYPFFAGVVIFRAGIFKGRPPRGTALAVIGALALLLLNTAWLRSARFDCVGVILVIPLIVAASSAVVITGRAVRVCEWLGRLSYPFYILHRPALLGMHSLFKRAPLFAGFKAFWPELALIIVLAATVVVLLLYDEPVRRWLTRLASVPRQ